MLLQPPATLLCLDDGLGFLGFRPVLQLGGCAFLRQSVSGLVSRNVAVERCPLQDDGAGPCKEKSGRMTSRSVLRVFLFILLLLFSFRVRVCVCVCVCVRVCVCV